MILKIDLKIVKLNIALRKMQKCQFCGKQYKRIGSFKKHLNLCYLLHCSKETIEKDVEENNNEPTVMELYYIVQTLLKKNNKLEERIEYLEGKLNRRKRKIKITSWLGQQQFDTVTFADFIKDFINCRECFFVSVKEWKKYAFTKKIEKALDKHYKKYYH